MHYRSSEVLYMVTFGLLSPNISLKHSQKYTLDPV